MLENKLKRSSKKAAKEQEEKPKESLPKGATIHLKGDFKEITREDIKQKFSDLGYETAFIAFNIGEPEAYVRLHEENAGKNVSSEKIISWQLNLFFLILINFF